MRFGSPKALADIYGTSVIGHLQKVLIDSKVHDIVIVLGDHREKIRPHLLNHKKIKVVYNKDYKLGQTSSLKAGLQSISRQACGFMLLPVDFPLIKRETIDELVREFCANKHRILIPAHHDKRGHPPIFNIALKDTVMNMSNDVGVNTLEHQRESETFLYAVADPGVVSTFNTPKEFEELKTLL